MILIHPDLFIEDEIHKEYDQAYTGQMSVLCYRSQRLSDHYIWVEST